MFDIDESGAPAYNWANKVKGWDLTDPVEGDIGGADNIPIKQLAERTRNLQTRLAFLEPISGGWNPVNSLFTTVLNIYSAITAKADSTAANLSGGNVTQWLTKLGISNLVMRSGVASFTGINIGYNAKTIFLPSALPNYDPATHNFFFTYEKPSGPVDLGGIHPIIYMYQSPAAGTLTSFDVRIQNIGTAGNPALPFNIHYAIIKKL